MKNDHAVLIRKVATAQATLAERIELKRLEAKRAAALFRREGK